MLRRILVICLIVAAIAAIAWLYFRLTTGDRQYESSISGIPASCALVATIDPGHYNDPEMQLMIELANSENNLGDVSFNPLDEWPKLVEELINLKSYQPGWKELLENSDIVFATTEQFRGDAWLMSIGLKKESSEGAVDELMYAWKADMGFAKREFKGSTIHAGKDIHYTVLNNCLIVSGSLAMMEEAVIQLQNKNLLSTKSDFSHAFNVSSADAFFNLLCKSGEASWMQLNPEKKNGSWILSGYLVGNDPKGNPLLLTATGKQATIADFIPANTSFLDAYSFPDFDSGWTQQEEYYSRTNPTANRFWSQAWKDMGDTCQCDLNELMLSWRTGEWGIAMITNSDSTMSEVLYLGVKDSLDVTSLMKPLFRTQGPSAGGVYELKYPSLFDRNKPQSILVETNYIVQKGNFVFVGNTPSDLKKVVDPASRLSDVPAFQRAKKTLDESGHFVFQSSYLVSPLPTGILNILKGFDGIGISTEAFKEDRVIVNIALPVDVTMPARTEEDVAEQVAEGEVAVPGEIKDVLRGPWDVKNHNTGKAEKIYQNKTKELCLVGEDGQVLWKNALDAEIVGHISQVDALKNGKLQYAFVAGNRLHVIDRNGKELQSFPVLLSGQASSSLFVFDYDNNRSYRMITGTEDGSMHNHNTRGKMNEGWKYSGTAPIAMVKHAKVSGEDVLIAITHAGSVKVLKKNGDIKLETTSSLADWDKKDLEIRALGNLKDLKIIYTTTTGESKTIGL